MLRQSDTLPARKKKVGTNKLVLGFAALAATAVIGTTGVAAAAQNSPMPGNGYGGNINIDLGVDVKGNNNVIEVIINIFR